MTQDEIKTVLDAHVKWTRGEAGSKRADLHRADLHRADLDGADLHGADLHGATLYGANLHGADLDGANLYGANLDGANLDGATLDGANLDGANLSGANNASLHMARLVITPEGEFVAWKKCRNDVLVKLLIPLHAKRSNATGRKCRAERALVLEVIGGEHGLSFYDQTTVYRKGELVHCDKWNDNRWCECGGGIHFFLTREEAAAFEY